MNSLQFRFPNAGWELILNKIYSLHIIIKKKYETRIKFVNFRRVMGHYKESPRHIFLIIIKFELK